MDAETFHIGNIGRLIEQNELKLRSDVCDHYVNKQRAITNSGRLIEHYMTNDEKAKFRAELEEAQAAQRAAKDAKEETWR